MNPSPRSKNIQFLTLCESHVQKEIKNRLLKEIPLGNISYTSIRSFFSISIILINRYLMQLGDPTLAAQLDFEYINSNITTECGVIEKLKSINPLALLLCTASFFDDADISRLFFDNETRQSVVLYWRIISLNWKNSPNKTTPDIADIELFFQILKSYVTMQSFAVPT